MKNCLTCGGAVLEPNKSYSYAGPICYCIVPPKIQRISTVPQLGDIDSGIKLLEHLREAEKKLHELNDAIKRLELITSEIGSAMKKDK